MRIALFNENQLGIVNGNLITDVSSVVPWDSTSPQESLVRLMKDFEKVKGRLHDLSGAPSYSLSEISLKAPVPNPRKIVAAPVNYSLHQDEMNQQFNNAEYTIEKLVYS